MAHGPRYILESELKNRVVRPGKTGHANEDCLYKGKASIFKPNKHGDPHLSELEVANNSFWRLYLPRHTARNTLVLNDNGKIIGVHVPVIDGFKHLEEDFDPSLYVDKGLPECLAMALFVVSI